MNNKTEYGGDEYLELMLQWENVKLFRDTIHKYVEIPRIYVKNIIDIYDMQRIKDVAQSGMRALFSAATHDRFSHSIGVYNIGKKAYNGLKKNIIKLMKSKKLCFEGIDEIAIEKYLEEWENLFCIACILHDIGHPACSHTLEFLYDDPYINLKDKGRIGPNVEEYRRCKEIKKIIDSDKEDYYSELRNSVAEKLNIKVSDVKGSPHERMAVLYITNGIVEDKIEESTLAKRIECIINSYCNYMNIKTEKTEKEVIEDIKFICRMITGQEYNGSLSSDLQNSEEMMKQLLNDIRNCIIRLLNGNLDVDSLDYVVRNSYSSGYDTSSVDVDRICNNFSVKVVENNRLVSVFEKSALSVIEGYITARNFEPMWLYSHHKIVYEIDVLYKNIYKHAAKFLYEKDLNCWIKIIVDELIKEKIYIEKIGKVHVDKNKDISLDENIAISFDTFINHFEGAKSINLLRTKLFELLKVDNVAAELYQQIDILDDFDLTLLNAYISKLKNYIECSNINEIDDKFKNDIFVSDNYKKYFELRNIFLFLKRIKFSKNNKLDKIFNKTKIFCFGSSIDDKDLDYEKLYDFLVKLYYNEISDLKMLYTGYLISPYNTFYNGKFLFNRSTDADLDAFFKQIYMQYENDIKQKDAEEFHSLLKEYFSRKHKVSLWKSYQEYKVFIENISKKSKISVKKVNDYILDLIKSGGNKVCFYNDGVNQKEFSNEVIYKTWTEEEISELKNLKKELGHFERLENKVIKKFNDIFSKEVQDIVIKIHKIKYKNFDNNIFVSFFDEYKNLKEIIGSFNKENLEFPYIFVDKDISLHSLRIFKENLEKNLCDYCVDRENLQFKNYSGGNEMSYDYNNGKIFRDVVHGDIFIPKKFLDLIDTPEFQRLRRIKQLATANYVFINSEHTRFSHSIGTFFIMNKMIEHFKIIFEKIGVEYKEVEIDALLAAALLHDIGHGPYSHTFERVSDNDKSHEEWTKEIIKGKTHINERLKINFPYDEFIDLVIDYIDKKNSNTNNDSLNFKFVFSSLISSQLDADRLDYLLRDSYNTGISYGNIDLQNIISAMQITEYNNKFYICISQDKMSHVEQLIFGRYKMYENVYFKSYKVFSESLVIKILERAKYLYNNNKLRDIKIDFFNSELALEKFLKLDDVYVNGVFNEWLENEDYILAEMCRCLLERRGYEHIKIMNDTGDDIEKFKRSIDKILSKYSYNIDKSYAFIYGKNEFSAYNYILTHNRKDEALAAEKIWILSKDGTISDFKDKTKLFSNGYNDENRQWYTRRNYIYYNKELLKMELKITDDIIDVDKKDLNNDIELIDLVISNLNIRKHIEIEEKYSCEEKIVDEIKQIFKNNGQDPKFDGYNIELKSEDVLQKDVYYDTEDFLLAKSKHSLRCRNKNGKYKYTIKLPTPKENFGGDGQFARFEYEFESGTNNLVDSYDFVLENIGKILEKNNVDINKECIDKVLKEKLRVENKRSKFSVKKGDFECEVCLDYVVFINGTVEKRDFQIEVELKSDYIHRVSLKLFADKLKSFFDKSLKKEEDSKYVKGLKMLGCIK